jgi:uncharacterized protein YjiK
VSGTQTSRAVPRAPGRIPGVRVAAFFCLVIPHLLTAQSSGVVRSSLSLYDVANQKAATAQLPSELREISGLACDGRGRVFCHNDEQAVVFQIDPVRGKILEKFSVGDRTFRRDFEGIAVADSIMFLVTSDGTLYEFTRTPSGGRAAARTYATGLGSGWDIEGLCYDPATRSLLIACKENPREKRLRHVYAFSLKSHGLLQSPRFILDVEKIEKKAKIKDFRPSAIERHPASGTFFILSSSEPAILELSPSGEILAAVRLPDSIHRQPEGLTFDGDLTLYISNEGKNHGTVSRYPRTR